MNKNTLLFGLAAAAALAVSCSGDAAKEYDRLKAGFDNPPREARTQVWWHWMNGNISKEGIRKDLEWMDRVGIGGFHHFDAALSTPQVVDKRLIYMDEGWKDAFAYAAKLADSLGLEMTVASAPGWSATGGPWVEPRDAMKKLVWRTLNVSGGSKLELTLPAAFDATGAFQNASAEGRGQASTGKYYEDIAVIAVPLPDDELSMAEMGAGITSSGGTFVLDELCNDDLTDGSVLPSPKEGNAWIQFSFPEARTIRAVSLSDGRGGGRMGAAGSASVWLEAGDDGRNFTRVAALQEGGAALRTISIPATTAKYFRVVYRGAEPLRQNPLGLGAAPARTSGTKVSELVLHSASKIHRSEDKSGFTAASSLASVLTPSSDSEAFASSEDVLDITSCMDKDGKLNWNAPEGRWKIYRFGFSLTGKQNHPAPAEATGLEVDKLDPDAWTRYFHTYIDMYKDAADGLVGKHGVQYILTDSYEAEQENWTPAMFEEFHSRRGYDLTPWMPVLAGAVIGSPEQSDAFLRDWRKTLGELIAANYDLLTKIAVEGYGMLGRYSEAHEGGRVYPVDGMDVKRSAAVPMSAMWVVAPWLGRTPDGEIVRSGYISDCQESASVAHVYGQNVAAAESLTAWGNVQYSYSPENLKAVADLELSCGINRFVIHESAHQPSDEYVPGFSLGGIGQWFNRHDTWAEQAGVWVDYMSRSCFMLQAGVNVADILVYYGEEANVTSLYGGRQPQLPFGYSFDYLNPDALLNCIEAGRNGSIVSMAGGTSYRILWLERNCSRMSVEVLRKLASLASKGVTIVGPRPTGTMGLQDDRVEFDRLVSEIWDKGRTNVFEDTSIDNALAASGLAPDIKSGTSELIRFLHRTMGDNEIFWINKPSDKAVKAEFSFRVSGLKPQIWHPDNGLIEDASYRSDGDRTIVEVPMVENDAVFVVFNGKAESSSFRVPELKENTLASLDGPWSVKFQEGRGAPESASFATLQSYTESKDQGIKYFSGAADYSIKASVAGSEGKIILDLGEVGNLAEVYVNGEYCGTAWKHPFRVDITSAVREGENDIRIKVVNLWVNRLIGDEQPDCTTRYTFTDARHYKADSPLLPSGLMGPVRIVSDTPVL